VALQPTGVHLIRKLPQEVRLLFTIYGATERLGLPPCLLCLCRSSGSLRQRLALSLLL